MFANMNLLTDEECKTLLAQVIVWIFSFVSFPVISISVLFFSFQDPESSEESNDIFFNNDIELCAGKKNKFPKLMPSFGRKLKPKSQYEKEKKDAKVLYLYFEILKSWEIFFNFQLLGLPSGYKPTKFFYKIRKNQTRDLLGTTENYPYDWYLGGVDSCQGDSGGPLWRNINKVEEVQSVWSTLIGRG